MSQKIRLARPAKHSKTNLNEVHSILTDSGYVCGRITVSHLRKKKKCITTPPPRPNGLRTGNPAVILALFCIVLAKRLDGGAITHQAFILLPQLSQETGQQPVC
jgi:hypothetical protein